MYTAFNYTPSNYFYNHAINPYMDIGESLYMAQKKEVEKCLERYISIDGIINASALKEHWFSVSKKDVFISHSHNDIHKVKAFAGWLHSNFGLESFIDSCSWGYCDDLLRKLDDKYCYDSKKDVYKYNLRNYTTSHVHMMLSTALTEMIDNSECVIFSIHHLQFACLQSWTKLVAQKKKKNHHFPVDISRVVYDHYVASPIS